MKDYCKDIAAVEKLANAGKDDPIELASLQALARLVTVLFGTARIWNYQVADQSSGDAVKKMEREMTDRTNILVKHVPIPSRQFVHTRDGVVVYDPASGPDETVVMERFKCRSCGKSSDHEIKPWLPGSVVDKIESICGDCYRKIQKTPPGFDCEAGLIVGGHSKKAAKAAMEKMGLPKELYGHKVVVKDGKSDVPEFSKFEDLWGHFNTKNAVAENVAKTLGSAEASAPAGFSTPALSDAITEETRAWADQVGELRRAVQGAKSGSSGIQGHPGGVGQGGFAGYLRTWHTVSDENGNVSRVYEDADPSKEPPPTPGEPSEGDAMLDFFKGK